MSKVLSIAEVYPPEFGGSGKWLWELYSRNKSSVHIAAHDSPGSETFDVENEIATTRLNLKFGSWGLSKSPLEYVRCFRRLSKVVRLNEPLAIHAAKCLPEGLIARMLGARFGLPYCVFVHGEELGLARTSTELRWLTRSTLRYAQILIANSEHTKELLTSEWKVPDERVKVVYPGVDCTRFQPCEPSQESRERLGWNDRPVLLTVGALQKRKGQDKVLQALPIIKTQFPDVLYCIAGDGWERQYLESLVHELDLTDHVELHERPSDKEIADFHQNCDVFILANRTVGWDFEGFGIVLLEAQASGRPVITGLTGGTREAVNVGTSGLQIDGESPNEIAEAVMALLKDKSKATEMGNEGRSWALQFDWSVAAQRAWEVLPK